MQLKTIPRKILVFNPSFIGDSILTTPLLKALKKLAPQSELCFCVRPESAPVLQSEEWRLITFDKRGKEKGPTGFMRFLNRLIQEKFDLVISAHRSARSALLSAMTGAKTCVGYENAAFSFLYTHKVKRNMEEHEVERLLALLLPLTVDYSLEAAKLLGGGLYTYYDSSYAACSSAFMRSAAQTPLVGINAGSTWPTKRWPVEYFAQTAQKLHEYGLSIAIFGGPSDEDVNNRLRALIDFEYFDYTNKVAFEKIPALIGAMNLYITNDSAPMHIAVSRGVSVVALFGPTLSSFGFAPYDGQNILCEKDSLPCRPCSKHGGDTCPEGHFSCMKELQTERVVEAALTLLGIST